MSQPTSEQIEGGASRAWNVYLEAVGGRALNGDPLPSWTALIDDPTKSKIVDGWRAVSLRLGSYWVDQFVTSERNTPGDPLFFSRVDGRFVDGKFIPD